MRPIMPWDSQVINRSCDDCEAAASMISNFRENAVAQPYGKCSPKTFDLTSTSQTPQIPVWSSLGQPYSYAQLC